jgi:deoxyadenosine/deoxycytidine kinase
MIKKLPTKNFEFMEINNILNLKDFINNLNTEYHGYILEVDMDYPVHLHDKHIDLPFAPEHYEDKLTPNFFNKRNYKIHIDHLKLCVKHVIFFF